MSVKAFPVAREEARATFDLMSNGEQAFERIVRRIDEARTSVMMRCFEWRDDDTGQEIARAVLRAADRGVAVTIYKDRVGSCYEHLEASKQSFFHKRIGVRARLQTSFLMAVYGRWGSLRQTPSALADAVRTHPKVTLIDETRFDHAKLYVFDGRRVILGGMGIGDDFRYTNVDFMVEISGGDAAERLADRYGGRARFDAGRPFDFLLHSFKAGPDQQAPSLAAERLALIAGARRRLTVEMAYLGDRDCTEALIAAVDRGVRLTLLTAARANVIGDLNLATCAEIMRRTGSPDHLRVVLHPRMVHGKAVVGDGEWVDVGSTNFTALSHGAYEEVDVFTRDPRLVAAVEQAIEAETANGRTATLPLPSRRVYVAIERAFSAYHSRKTKRSARPRAAGRAARSR